MISEPRLGPTKSNRDKEIALEELLKKLIEVVREVNLIREQLGHVEPES